MRFKCDHDMKLGLHGEKIERGIINFFSLVNLMQASIASEKNMSSILLGAQCKSASYEFIVLYKFVCIKIFTNCINKYKKCNLQIRMCP